MTSSSPPKRGGDSKFPRIGVPPAVFITLTSFSSSHRHSREKDKASVREWSQAMSLPYVVALSSNGGWYVAYKSDEGVVAWSLVWADGKCPIVGKARKECLCLLPTFRV